jgi:hypothetical protein
MKEGERMKVLKIENSKGFFTIDGAVWKPIDEIEKTDLMSMLDIVLRSESEMDQYSTELIGNQAHQIIYRSIFEKLNSLAASKSQFKDESDRLYLDAIAKYSV